MAKIDALRFVVLFKGNSLGLFGFLLLLRLLSDLSIFSAFVFELFLVEFVVKVSNVSSSLSGPVVSSGSASPVEEMAVCQLLFGSGPIVSNFGIFFCFLRGLFINGLVNLGHVLCFLDFLLLG